MAVWSRRNWFLLAVLAALVLAAEAPGLGRAGGTLRLDLVKPWLIAAVFLIAGATLPLRELGQALARLRVHLFIQGFGLVLVPLVVLALDRPLAALGLDLPLRQGLLVLAALPTTIAACVALTRAAGGDEAVALCSSAIGSLLGVLLTPAIILLLTGRAAAVPLDDAVRQLVLIVALPLVLGQGVRLALGARLAVLRPWLAQGTLALLVLLIFHVFCDSLALGIGVPGRQIAAVGAVVVGLHALLLATAHLASAWPALGMGRRQRVAATICATQKTAALGVPLLAILYAGDPDLPLLSLPLLMYHFLQLLVASLLVPAWRRWIEAETPAA